METYEITQKQLDDTPQKKRRWRWPGVTGPGTYTWNESRNRYEPLQSTTPSRGSTATGHDFDKGFGIGGLGRFQETSTIPTPEQMKRIEKMMARATTCRRCGQNDVFDGAMFTTVGGNICDDCCG